MGKWEGNVNIGRNFQHIMSWTSGSASPDEVQKLLAASSNPAEPSCDLATLESLCKSWPYPKGLEFREGFIYADLCYQTGWSYFHFGELEAALRVWRDCPWPAADDAERQALLELLQPAIADQTLVLSPPVVELLNRGLFSLSDVTGSLANPSCNISHSTSGLTYLSDSLLVRPEGLYRLSLEFDASTLYFASCLPAEVSAQLTTARTFFQLGEPAESARWLLRAAFTSSGHGQDEQALAFLKKAAQLAPENASVKASHAALLGRGTRLTLASRVITERAMAGPLPSKRTAVRPAELPERVPLLTRIDVGVLGDHGKELEAIEPSADGSARNLLGRQLTFLRAFEIWNHCRCQEEAVEGIMLVEGIREVHLSSRDSVVQKLSLALAISPDKLGQWKRDLSSPLNSLLEAWPERGTSVPGAEYELPVQVDLMLLACDEPWKLLLSFELEMAGVGTEVELSAWLRRLKKEHGLSLMLISDECCWFYLDSLPSDDRIDKFFSDLLCLAPEFEGTFEVPHIRPLGNGWLIPVSLLAESRKLPEPEKP